MVFGTKTCDGSTDAVLREQAELEKFGLDCAPLLHTPTTMQAGGNRARFFAPQAAKSLDAPSTSTNSESPRDGNPMLSSPCSKETPLLISSERNASSTLTSSGALVPFNKLSSSTDVSYPSRSASDNSEDDTIAQRTRIIETELVFKAKREGHGRLNVSGLIKHVNANALQTAPQTASIKEVADHEELGTRSPRQHSSTKLMTKNIASPRPSAFSSPPPPSQKGSFHLPPSNQLVSQTFKIPLHYPPHTDITTEEAPRIKKLPSTSRADLSNTHISTGLSAASCDDSIKSLTTAFNRKHTGGSRNPRFSSPVSHRRRGRSRSPHVPFEDDPVTDFSGSHGRGVTVERNFSSQACEEHELQEPNYQGSEGYHGSAQNHHGAQELHAKRGEKRINNSEGESVGAPLGKRARMDTYDEFLSNHRAPSPMSDSPEVDPRDNPMFKETTSQGRQQITTQDPSLKLFSGQDLDDYVATHIERYEAAKRRWTECSGDEWERGADELADKLTKVLDFVKEHMRRRVALYASLHSKIDQHQRECAETSEMLKNAKSKLVAKAGIVVDGGRL